MQNSSEISVKQEIEPVWLQLSTYSGPVMYVNESVNVACISNN